MPTSALSRWLPSLFVLTVAAFVFGLTMPYMDVNRHQENWYMGTSYTQLKTRQLVVSKWADPFGENGPLGVYPPTAIALATGALRPMRWYQFIFTLISLFLFVRYVQHQSVSHPPAPQDQWKPWVIVPVMLSVWITMPQSLLYPVQMNGMYAGLVFFICGWLWIGKRLYLSVFLMGVAYSFKTQFLGMWPGLAIYLLFLAPRMDSISKNLRRFAICAFIYFLPACVIIPLCIAPLGVFKNSAEYRDYALNGPREFVEQGLYHGKRLLQGGMSTAHKSRVDEIRIAERRGWGPIAYFYIVFSFASCIVYTLYAFWRRWIAHQTFSADQHSLAALACAGVFYWIHYLIIYRYPYWYNVLPIMVFSIPIAARITTSVVDWSAHHLGPRKSGAVALSICLVGTAWFILYANRLPGWRNEPPGNSLVLYDWMR